MPKRACLDAASALTNEAKRRPTHLQRIENFGSRSASRARRWRTYSDAFHRASSKALQKNGLFLLHGFPQKADEEPTSDPKGALSVAPTEYQNLRLRLIAASDDRANDSEYPYLPGARAPVRHVHQAA